MTDEARFWAKVAKGDGCWNWTAAARNGGYGALLFRGHVRAAHRVAWMLANGPIPTGLVVRHKCDNRRCVRVDHLELGTQAENMRDMVERGRSLHGERHLYSKLTDEQVIEMRHRRFFRLESLGQLQRRFGLALPGISLIVRGLTWRNVGGPRSPARWGEIARDWMNELAKPREDGRVPVIRLTGGPRRLYVVDETTWFRLHGPEVTT